MNLYPFQEQAVSQMLSFLKSNETHSVYNACEQGLGKTIQTIEVLNRLKVKSTLIICPAIMRLVWLEELEKWRKPDEPGIARALMSSADIKDAQGASTIVVSYDLARTPSVLKFLKAQKFECNVFDEAHALKNTRAKRTKVCFRELWDIATYHILLSGTPFTVSVVDGYSPFHRILPKEFPNFHDFVSRFSYARTTPWGTQYFGLKNADALKKIIRSNFYIRYTKDEVLTELPPKIFQKIILPLEYAVKPKANSQADELRIQAEMVRRFLEEGKSPVIPSCLAEHRRLQGEAKIPAIVEFCKNLLEQEIPIVVFAWHKSVVAGLVQALEKYKPVYITGETSSKNREQAVRQFQNGESLLFIATMGSAGTGITLTASCNLVLAELDWSPAVVAQAIDRAHRIGTKSAVNVYWFVAEASIDKTISDVVMERTKLFKSVLDDKA